MPKSLGLGSVVALLYCKLGLLCIHNFNAGNRLRGKNEGSRPLSIEIKNLDER
jgi:hypothetical protein